jgi:hypothetical protein
MSKSGMKFQVMSIVAVLLLCSVTIAYAMGQYPGVVREEQPKLTGTFTVIFYGGTYSNDPVTVAILDVEGDDYTIEPYTSEYNYQIKKDVPAEQALKESELFVSRHSDFYKSQIKRITDEKGRIIGYEVRPLYHTWRFGRRDILNVRYWIKDRTVFVTVDMKRAIRNRILQRESDND